MSTATADPLAAPNETPGTGLPAHGSQGPDGRSDTGRDTDHRAWQPPPFEGYERIPMSTLRPLMRVRNASSALAIAFDYGVIALTIVAMHTVLPIWLYPLAVIVIGARQQGMLVLLHEASHRKLFRQRRLNDFVGEVLLSWPLFISMISYRANHFSHHRFMNTELDPDWIRYLSPEAEERHNWRYERRLGQVLRPLVLDFLGFGAIGQLKRVLRLAKPRNHDPRKTPAQAQETLERRFPTYPKSALWGFRLALIAVLVVTDTWLAFLLYWLVPGLTMLKMCVRLRLMAGHFSIYGGEGVRTTLATPIERFLLAPHNIGHHAEHHLYPAVYFGDLPKVHKLMRERGDYDGKLPIRITYGYRELIADWTRDVDAQLATLSLPRSLGLYEFH